ncbi:MAG: Tn7 transposase TnsA N-terminal domain-containing protein [Solirubrobacteraceae bacterium]
MNPGVAHGRFEEPTKSAYSFESYDGEWEREYMQELEADPEVDAWTKRHKIRIPYIDPHNRKREYRPDFLVRLDTGQLQLHEVKGGHLIENPDTKKKFEAAKAWCVARGIEWVVVTK